VVLYHIQGRFEGGAAEDAGSAGLMFDDFTDERKYAGDNWRFAHQ
jgi:hypothetical protein